MTDLDPIEKITDRLILSYNGRVKVTKPDGSFRYLNFQVPSDQVYKALKEGEQIDEEGTTSKNIYIKYVRRETIQ